MAERRKVGNLMALAVLAAVTQRPMHPYEMASALRDWGKDDDMQIKWGSLYTVVRNLAKHGFLAAVGSDRQGARPERTVYQITDAGRTELADWTRELISTPQRELPRFKAGLSVLSVLPPREVIGLLRQRLDLVEADIAQRRAALVARGRTIPRLFLVEDEYDLAMRAAEASWIATLLAELTTGTYPDLPTWQAFHETGEIPPELADLNRPSGTPE